MVGIAAKKSIARFVVSATTGEPKSHQRIRLKSDPTKANISILSVPPVPYFIAKRAMIVGAIASLTATQTVSSAPLALYEIAKTIPIKDQINQVERLGLVVPFIIATI